MILTFDDKLHVFWGVDDATLADVAFYNLRAEGGFLVSAKRARGAAEFVALSLDPTVPAPGTLTVVTDMTSGACVVCPLPCMPSLCMSALMLNRSPYLCVGQAHWRGLLHPPT